MIAVDWGTSSFRAFRLVDGQIVDRVASKSGLLASAGRFEEVLRENVGHWLALGETQVLLSGMVGSRTGWVEATYVPCPANVQALAAGLTPVPFDGADVRIVPGVSGLDADRGVPEVMRGEETQILGALESIGGSATLCMPGTHSKWVRVEDGKILEFATYMTGECFAVIGRHTILAQSIEQGAPQDLAAFDEGVDRSANAGGLLHHLFGIRTKGLFGELPARQATSYLSGVLIGHEVRAALAGVGADNSIMVIGDAGLAGSYQRAIRRYGRRSLIVDGECAATGLAMIGRATAWMDRASEEI